MTEQTTAPDPEDEGFHDTGAGPDPGADAPGQADEPEPPRDADTELPF